MKFHELGLILPDFVERPSGLLAPVEVEAQITPPPLPPGLKPPRPAPSVVVNRPPPVPIDNIRAWIDEPHLGLEPTSFERLLQYLEVVPFETACHVVSWLLRRLHPIQVDVQAQLELADIVYAQLRDVSASMREAAIGERGHLPFAEPLLLALMRLLVARSPDAVPNGFENYIEVVFERALLGLPSALDNWSLQGHEASDLPSWLGFFMQKSNFIRQRASLNELVRPHRLFELMAGSLDERAAKERCEVNAALKERYGLTHEEQFRLGMGLAAILHLFDDEPGNACRVPPGEFPRLLESVKLEDRHDAALDLVSGDREHFQREFDRLDQDGTMLMSMRIPFQQRPFIRFRDGSLVLLSPSLFHEWLTDGFHYRALDAVAGVPPVKSRSGRYLRFAGHVFERYCLDLAKESHRSGFGATPVVSGDIRFITRQGEQRTVDLLVGMGPDLVLLEIEHHRPGLSVSVHGSSDAAARDLRDHLIHKMERLAACITVLRDPGGPKVEGLDMRRIRRIWPVVLSAEPPPQQPPVWDFLDREAGGMLKELGAEPLTILDVEDFEMLCGVVETGRSLASMLERKCRPEFARLELRVWFKEDPLAPAQRRPDALGNAFLRLMDDATSEIRLVS